MHNQESRKHKNRAKGNAEHKIRDRKSKRTPLVFPEIIGRSRIFFAGNAALIFPYFPIICTESKLPENISALS
jgi:hypothetical protein